MPVAGTNGQAAERLAEKYLCNHGLRRVERNYRCKLGEIDLVMRDGNVLVFVEIRHRTDSRFGFPAETVTAAKQRRLIRAAHHYLQSHFARDEPRCRFDVIGLSGQLATVDVHWVKDAFGA